MVRVVEIECKVVITLVRNRNCTGVAQAKHIIEAGEKLFQINGCDQSTSLPIFIVATRTVSNLFLIVCRYRLQVSLRRSTFCALITDSIDTILAHDIPSVLQFRYNAGSQI